MKGSAVIKKVEMPGSRNERQASSQKGGRGRGGGRAKIVGWCIMVILPFLFLFVPFILHQATVETASASLPGDMSSIGLKSRIAKLKQRQDAIDGMLRQHSERDSILSGGARRLPSTGPASLDRLDRGSPTTSASSRDWREKSSDSSTSGVKARRDTVFFRSSDATPEVVGGSLKRRLGNGNPSHKEPKSPLPCSRNASIRVDEALAEESGVFYYRRDVQKCALSAISHKMEPGCKGAGNSGKVPSSQRQLLVVGVQRSGTHYAWEMYNRLGVHVHHEGLGPDGAVSWFFAYKARSYAINNPLPLNDHSFCFVFHQVRHPMRVVSSIVKASRKPWDPYWEWITKTDPSVCGDSQKCRKVPLLHRSAKQWLVWNEHIETYADVRFRVEDTSPRTVCRLAMFEEELCSSYGQYHTTSSKEIQPIVEPRAPADNHTGADHLRASWESIEELDTKLADEMKAMTRRYGYHLDAAMHPQSLSTAVFRAGGVEKVNEGGASRQKPKGVRAKAAGKYKG